MNRNNLNWRRAAVALSMAMIGYRILMPIWLVFLYLIAGVGIVGLWYANIASLFLLGGFLGYPESIGELELYIYVSQVLAIVSTVLIGWLGYRWSRRYAERVTWSWYVIIFLGLIFYFVRLSVNPEV